MAYLQQVPIDQAEGAVHDAADAQPDDAYAPTATLLDLFPAPQGG